MPTMPTTDTPTAVVTSLDEAAAALAAFQDSMAREAERNGHGNEFTVWIERAIQQIPGLREVPTAPVEPIPTGTAQMTFQFKTLPGVTADDWHTGRESIKTKSQQFMAAWAEANGYPSGTYSVDQQRIAYVLHHPDEVDSNGPDTSMYIDVSSITNYRNAPHNPATARRVEFVR